MVENTVAAHAADDASRGLPYYEKLRRDLRETINKKRVVEKNLAALDEQIYKSENSYLEETSAGNIIKGFDNYIKGASTGGAGGMGGGGSYAGGRKRLAVSDSDRIFSRSSASLARDSPAPTPTSATHTASHAPTPTSTGAVKDSVATPTSAVSAAPAKQTKKTKKAAAAAAAAAAAEEDDGPPKKRGRVDFGARADA
ncbi:MAG: hypothetical protein M1825_002826 [Sarcosagium campestre]|nr:MAG: hypothetical protein M1825_002826 [Sarcosagium campestre]